MENADRRFITAPNEAATSSPARKNGNCAASRKDQIHRDPICNSRAFRSCRYH